MKRILVMGLPGAGKTYLATKLVKLLSATHFNGDEVRKQHNDWDFSHEGRIRQAHRMHELSKSCNTPVIIDFICPLQEMRQIVNADWTIWMDTENKSRYADTDKIFEPPSLYDFRVTEKNVDFWAPYIADRIANNIRRPKFNWQQETVQMLGRWQPWHAGHRALFERALAKTGQVCIMIRDCQGWQQSNPFAIEEVKYYIRRDLDPLYQGQYEIIIVPNIVNITYGRDVGYKIEQEVFDEQTHSISATKIRKAMGL